MDLPLLKELCDARSRLLDQKNKAKLEAMNKMDKDTDVRFNKTKNKDSRF